jgi:hypothetical protein
MSIFRLISSTLILVRYFPLHSKQAIILIAKLLSATSNPAAGIHGHGNA